MKFYFSLMNLLCLLILSSCGGGEGESHNEESNPTSNNNIVLIPDANLTAAIREALNIPKGELRTTDLAKLEKLVAPSKGITDLTGLEYATNLSHLDLNGLPNTVSDLSPLSNLTNLSFLGLGDNRKISDITPLADLKNLKNLNLYSNAIIDISALSGLTNLETVSFWQCNFSDVKPLAKLTKLKSIELGLTPVKDYSPLVNLTNLNALSTSRDYLSDEQRALLEKALPNCKISPAKVDTKDLQEIAIETLKEANTNSVWESNAGLKKIRSESIHHDQLIWEGEKAFSPDQSTPYTGWVLSTADGEVINALYFKGGSKDGMSVKYWPNGNIKHIETFKNGIKEGLATFWDKGFWEEQAPGMKALGEWKENKRHGFYVKLDKNGTEVSRRNYKNGEQVDP